MAGSIFFKDAANAVTPYGRERRVRFLPPRLRWAALRLQTDVSLT
jgi:hypothetical protein